MRALRLAAGLNQIDAAKAIGIKQPSLSAIENDGTYELRGPTLAGICAFFGVTPDYILRGDETAPGELPEIIRRELYRHAIPPSTLELMLASIRAHPLKASPIRRMEQSHDLPKARVCPLLPRGQTSPDLLSAPKASSKSYSMPRRASHSSRESVVNVVQLNKVRNKCVTRFLEGLLDAARRGEIQGVVAVVKLGPDRHRAGVAGEYAQHPEQAMQGVFQMERHLRIEL